MEILLANMLPPCHIPGHLIQDPTTGLLCRTHSRGVVCFHPERRYFAPTSTWGRDHRSKNCQYRLGLERSVFTLCGSDTLLIDITSESRRKSGVHPSTKAAGVHPQTHGLTEKSMFRRNIDFQGANQCHVRRV